MTGSKAPTHLPCPTCRRSCAVGNWSCDLFDGKAYCPLCGEPITLYEFLKQSGMLGSSRVSVQPARATRRPKE